MDQETNADIESTAREMGWRPKEEFRGDPDSWVDAETFVKRGENFIPILRKNNQELKSKLDATNAKVEELNKLLQASQDAIEALKEFQSEETRRQVEKARKDLIAKLREARDSGDVETEVEIQDELDRLKEAKQESKPAPSQTQAEPPKEHPDFAQWKIDNPWFLTDARRRGLALGIAEELRADPKNHHLQGRAFFDRVAEEVSAMLDSKPTSKVDGGRPSGQSSGSVKRGRGYGDLPAEAKAACDRQGQRLVGPGRAFKDVDAWRAHYAKVYFEGESE